MHNLVKFRLCKEYKSPAGAVPCKSYSKNQRQVGAVKVVRNSIENSHFSGCSWAFHKPHISGQPLNNETAVEQPILKLELQNFIWSFNIFYNKKI